MKYEISSVEQITSCNTADAETVVYLHSDNGLVLELVFEELVSKSKLGEWIGMMNNPLRESDCFSVDEVRVCDDETCRAILSCTDFKVNVRAKDCDSVRGFVDDLNNPESVSKEVLWDEYARLSREILVKKQSVSGLEVRRDRVLRRLLLE